MLPGSSLREDVAVLVRRALSGNHSRHDREDAWHGIIRIVGRIARSAARRHGCGELEEDAVGYIWEKLKGGKFEPERGRFDSWSYVVLRRRAVDLRRRSSRCIGLEELHEACLPLVGISPGHRDESGLSGECGFRLNELRRLLDRLSETFPGRRTEIGYFGVLLIQLRLALALRLARADWSDPGPRSSLVAVCMPWRRSEGGLRIREGWPSLAEIWDVVGDRLNHPPHRIAGVEFCRLLQGSEKGVTGITSEVWAQWVRRAKRFARKQLVG